MAHELVREVFDFAPEDVTGPDLMVLVVIAEGAQVEDRPGWPARTWGGNLAAAARIKPGSLSRVLQRLRDHDLEVRVPIATDAAGRTVYAHRGTATTYRLPDLERLAIAEGRTSLRPVIDRTEIARTHIQPNTRDRPDPGPAKDPGSPDGGPAKPVVRLDARPSLAGPTSSPNQKNQNQPPTSERRPVAVPEAGGLVAVVRDRVPELVTGLPAATLDADAARLDAAGWTAEALGAELDRQDFTGARGPGLLRSRLATLAENGPPSAPRSATSSDDERCAHHGTRGRANCSSCRSEVLTGERHPDDIGRVPQLPAPKAAPDEVSA